MRSSLSGAITFAIVFGHAAVVFADPITITVDRRRVIAWLPGETAPAEHSDTLVAAAGPDSSGASTATLTSSYTNPQHWFGTGVIATTITSSEWSGAFSMFEVDFTVTSPVSYSFDGSFTSSQVPSGCCRTGSFAALYVDAGRDRDGELIGSPLFAFGTGRGDDTARTTGFLMPGNYAFFAAASSVHEMAGGTDGTFQFTLDFTSAETAPVPEPASLLLLGTGLAGVCGYRRRTQNRARQDLRRSRSASY